MDEETTLKLEEKYKELPDQQLIKMLSYGGEAYEEGVWDLIVKQAISRNLKSSIIADESQKTKEMNNPKLVEAPSLERGHLLLDKQALEKAEKHIKNAWIVGIISASVTLLFSAIGAYSETYRFKSGYDTWSLFDVALIAGLTFGIYKRNRLCALSLLIYFVLTKLAYAAHTGKFAHGIGALLFGYFFFQGTRAAFQIHKHLVETGQKNKKKRGVLFYIGAGISILVIIAFGCLVIIGVFSPETEVLPGKMLRKKYSDFVIEQGLIEDGEEIIYWYSNGLLDFKSGVYFFTREKVVVYSKDWEDPAIIIPLDMIDDIYFKHSRSFFEESAIFLILNDDTEVYFPVSNEKGGDRRFYKTLDNMWKKRLKAFDRNK